MPAPVMRGATAAIGFSDPREIAGVLDGGCREVISFT